MPHTKGEATRREIIEQVAPLFNQRGFAGASLSQVMEATGLQKGGIYNHFKSKEELALAAFHYYVDLVVAHHTAALEGKTSARERLEAHLEAFCSLWRDPPIPGGCPLINMVIKGDDTFPALRIEARAAKDLWRARLRETVEIGIDSGELKPDLDADRVAMFIIAALQGGVILRWLYDDPAHLDSTADQLRLYFAGALFSDEITPQSTLRPPFSIDS